VYARCLGLELATAGLFYEAEVRIPVRYKGLVLEHGDRADFNERRLVDELRSIVN
jgi:hypothetical protein